MMDYDRLTADWQERWDDPDYGPDRAARWSVSHPIKYGALALAFWAIAVGMLASAVSC
jgi:hypothetical protein